jgi:hypothetical protein
MAIEFDSTQIVIRPPTCRTDGSLNVPVVQKKFSLAADGLTDMPIAAATDETHLQRKIYGKNHH